MNKIIYLKDKVILPDGRRIDKTPFITKNGFDVDGFNKYLATLYKKL